MKTHLIFLFSCLLFSVLHAQTEKGRYIIGSSTNIAGGNLPLEFYLPSEHNNLGIGFGTVHTEYKRSDGTVVKSSEKLNSFNISPVFGYFVAENLALGGHLSAQSVWTKDDYSTASVTGFSYGPFVRYYFQANTWRPYAEIRGGGAVIKQKYHDKSGNEDDSTDKSNTY
ncbi:MAG: hypothetical protein IT269_01815, partial [Saprospiraceae bacterium]|nr:hypothetical protein [Saprospiraceae bacterium]